MKKDIILKLSDNSIIRFPNKRIDRVVLDAKLILSGDILPIKLEIKKRFNNRLWSKCW